MERDIQFTDASSGNPTGFSWDFGDESTPSTEENPFHTYEEEDTYNVTETVSKTGYSPDSVTKQVSTEDLPKEWVIRATDLTGELLIKGMVFYKLNDLGPYVLGTHPITEGGNTQLLKWNGVDGWDLVVWAPNDENCNGGMCVHNDRIYFVGPTSGKLFSWATGETNLLISEFVFSPAPGSVEMVDFEGILFALVTTGAGWRVYGYDDDNDNMIPITELQTGDTGVSIAGHVPGSDLFVLTGKGRLCSVAIDGGAITDMVVAGTMTQFSKLTPPVDNVYYTVSRSAGKLLSWQFGNTDWTVVADSNASSIETVNGRLYLVGSYSVQTYRYKISSDVLVLYADLFPNNRYVDETAFINGRLWATAGGYLCTIDV